MHERKLRAWNVMRCLVGLMLVLVLPAVAEELTLKASTGVSESDTGTVEFTFEVEELPAAPMGATTSPVSRIVAVPEPSAIVLVLLGGLGIMLFRGCLRRR